MCAAAASDRPRAEIMCYMDSLVWNLIESHGSQKLMGDVKSHFTLCSAPFQYTLL